MAAFDQVGGADYLKTVAQTDPRTFSEDLGIKLENVALNMLGKAKRVTIDKDNCAVVDGACMSHLIIW